MAVKESRVTVGEHEDEGSVEGKEIRSVRTGDEASGSRRSSRVLNKLWTWSSTAWSVTCGYGRAIRGRLAFGARGKYSRRVVGALKPVELDDLDVPRGLEALEPVRARIRTWRRWRACPPRTGSQVPTSTTSAIPSRRMPVRHDLPTPARPATSRRTAPSAAPNAVGCRGRGGERERRDHGCVRGRVRVRAGRRMLRARAVRVGRGEDGRRYGREEDDKTRVPSVKSSEPPACAAPRALHAFCPLPTTARPLSLRDVVEQGSRSG
jgi:hypothetical protein